MISLLSMPCRCRRRFPTSARGRAVDHTQQRTDRELLADLEPWARAAPTPNGPSRPRVSYRPPASDKYRAAGSVQIALLESERPRRSSGRRASVVPATELPDPERIRAFAHASSGVDVQPHGFHHSSLGGAGSPSAGCAASRQSRLSPAPRPPGSISPPSPHRRLDRIGSDCPPRSLDRGRRARGIGPGRFMVAR